MSTSMTAFPRLPSVWDGPMVLHPIHATQGNGGDSRLEAPVRQALAELTAVLAGEDMMAALGGDPADAGADPAEGPASVTVPGDIVAWFAARGIDLDGHVEMLLRSYMAEIERRG